MLVKITTKYASYSLVTFVTHKRFAVLFFPPSCCVNSLRSEDGDGSENVAEKVNSRSFNLHRDYSKSLTLSDVGEPS